MGPKDPIFVGGMYKSGTSLIRAMLGRHSRLFAGLETQWLNERWEVDAAERRQRWLERLAVFFDTRLGDLSDACQGATDVESCLDRAMDFLAARAGKTRWVEKTPGNVGAIERILRHWPHARIVHIIRDPRDVFASIIESRKWSTPEEFVGHWIATVAAARKWLAGQGGVHPAYYELRYERLVCGPEEEMRKVLAFLGERFERQTSAFPGQPEDFDRVRKATGKESRTLKRLAQPITAGRVGVWTKIVAPERWETLHAELLRGGGGDLVDKLITETDLIRGSDMNNASETYVTRVDSR